MQYRCTHLYRGYSLSELLNGCQRGILIAVLVPSPSYIIGIKQYINNLDTINIHKKFKAGSPSYAIYFELR